MPRYENWESTTYVTVTPDYCFPKTPTPPMAPPAMPTPPMFPPENPAPSMSLPSLSTMSYPHPAPPAPPMSFPTPPSMPPMKPAPPVTLSTSCTTSVYTFTSPVKTPCSHSSSCQTAKIWRSTEIIPSNMIKGATSFSSSHSFSTPGKQVVPSSSMATSHSISTSVKSATLWSSKTSSYSVWGKPTSSSSSPSSSSSGSWSGSSSSSSSSYSRYTPASTWSSYMDMPSKSPDLEMKPPFSGADKITSGFAALVAGAAAVMVIIPAL